MKLCEDLTALERREAIDRALAKLDGDERVKILNMAQGLCERMEARYGNRHSFGMASALELLAIVGMIL